MISSEYEFENALYTVEATEEIHERLKDDADFFREFVVDKEIARNNAGPNESADLEEKENIFKWTEPTTKLLISCYKERQEHFRNPKLRKRTVWGTIKDNFFKNGYVITEQDLDRKWRNLKKTYTTLVDNKKSTGRGRICWQYFEDFQDIYNKDKSLNLPITISSLTKPDVTPVPHLPSYAIDIDTPSTSSCSNLPEQKNPTTPSQNIPISLKRKKMFLEEKENQKGRNKHLYTFRKQLVEVEDKRVEELKLIRLAIEESNKLQHEQNLIQNERNKMLQNWLQKE